MQCPLKLQKTTVVIFNPRLGREGIKYRKRKNLNGPK